MKKQPKTISLNEFAKDFNHQQKKIVTEEMKYYDLLTSFKEARKKKGFTQGELAKRAHVNRTTLNKVESGVRNATINTLEKVATALGMKLEVKVSY